MITQRFDSIAKLLIIILVSLGAGGCLVSTDPAPATFGTGPRRILIVGNSLTGYNELGAMVVAIADSAKVQNPPTVDVYWLPNYAVIDHWADGAVQKMIARGRYDVVILQQGPTSVGLNRDTLRLAAKLFAPGIRGAGGLPALLSVWPTIDRQQDFDEATRSYEIAAQDVQGAHIPGGEVWRAAWRQNPSLQLYAPDGLHPSVLGSYAVALSIVGILYERSVTGVPTTVRLPTGTLIDFDAATVRILQAAADEANRNHGIQGTR